MVDEKSGLLPVDVVRKVEKVSVRSGDTMVILESVVAKSCPDPMEEVDPGAEARVARAMLQIPRSVTASTPGSEEWVEACVEHFRASWVSHPYGDDLLRHRSRGQCVCGERYLAGDPGRCISHKLHWECNRVLSWLAKASAALGGRIVEAPDEGDLASSCSCQRHLVFRWIRTADLCGPLLEGVGRQSPTAEVLIPLLILGGDAALRSLVTMRKPKAPPEQRAILPAVLLSKLLKMVPSEAAFQECSRVVLRSLVVLGLALDESSRVFNYAWLLYELGQFVGEFMTLKTFSMSARMLYMADFPELRAWDQALRDLYQPQLQSVEMEAPEMLSLFVADSQGTEAVRRSRPWGMFHFNAMGCGYILIMIRQGSSPLRKWKS